MHESRTPLEESVRRLQDRMDIIELTHRYCDMVWQRSGDAISELFTLDGMFKSSDLAQPITGREAIASFFSELALRETVPHPFVHNHMIELEGDSATMRCYLDLRQEGGRCIVGGYYDDALTRTKHGWLFNRRLFHQVFSISPDSCV